MVLTIRWELLAISGECAGFGVKMIQKSDHVIRVLLIIASVFVGAEICFALLKGHSGFLGLLVSVLPVLAVILAAIFSEKGRKLLASDFVLFAGEVFYSVLMLFVIAYGLR